MLKTEVEKLKAMSVDEFAKLYYGRQFRVNGETMTLQGYEIRESETLFIMGWHQGWHKNNLNNESVLLGESKTGKYWYALASEIYDQLPKKGHIVISKYKPCEK